MSELPSINTSSVQTKLLTRLSESLLQGIQLEVLAEALRSERDEAHNEVHRLRSELDAIRTAPQSTEVHDITTLSGETL